MKIKIAALVAVIGIISSAFAGECPAGGCGGKGKSDKKKEGEKTSLLAR